MNRRSFAKHVVGYLPVYAVASIAKGSQAQQEPPVGIGQPGANSIRRDEARLTAVRLAIRCPVRNGWFTIIRGRNRAR